MVHSHRPTLGDVVTVTLPDERIAIIYDRAECDFAAYLPDGYFDAVVHDAGLDLSDVRDSYDAVIHMVTAADGAEHAYTLENNAARSETPEQARQLDRATVAAWAGHPHLQLVANRGTFADKLDDLVGAALHMLGDPYPHEIERKFLLEQAPDLDVLTAQTGYVAVRIEQVYLQSERGEEVRIRRRRQGRTVTCVRTVKRDVAPGVRAETERPISPIEYLDLLAAADPDTVPIVKTRHLFVHGNHRFELDEFHEPFEGWLMEVETADVDARVELPSWLGKVDEVTADRRWRNFAIAGR